MHRGLGASDGRPPSFCTVILYYHAKIINFASSNTARWSIYFCLVLFIIIDEGDEFLFSAERRQKAEKILITNKWRRCRRRSPMVERENTFFRIIHHIVRQDFNLGAQFLRITRTRCPIGAMANRAAGIIRHNAKSFIRPRVSEKPLDAIAGRGRIRARIIFSRGAHSQSGEWPFFANRYQLDAAALFKRSICCWR
jgi:hypothetical protein